jgi:hypothetical protein
MFTLIIIDYQMNNLEYSYTSALVRTLAGLIVMICGSSIRYQTLSAREKSNFFQLMSKERDAIERYIVHMLTKANIGRHANMDR